MARRTITPALVALLPLSAALAGCQAGQESPPATSGDECVNYPDGVIELVVPYSTGGGFDTWARVIAPEIEEHLPGSPSIPVINRTGAGGLVGTMELVNEDPDGRLMAINEPGGLATALIGGLTNAPFDELRAVSRVTVGPETLVVRSDAEWDTIADLQAAAADAPFLMATNGLAAVQVISTEELGIGFTQVDHEGSSEMLVSIARGDTDFAILPLSSVSQWIRDGELTPLLLIGTPDEDNPDFDLVEGVTTLDEATGMDGLGAALEQHRMLLVAPETPQCMIEALSDAVGKVFDEPDFTGRVEEAGLLPAYLDAEAAQEIYDNTFASLEGYADLLAEIAE